jgi:hypothetical protein
METLFLTIDEVQELLKKPNKDSTYYWLRTHNVIVKGGNVLRDKFQEAIQNDYNLEPALVPDNTIETTQQITALAQREQDIIDAEIKLDDERKELKTAKENTIRELSAYATVYKNKKIELAKIEEELQSMNNDLTFVRSRLELKWCTNCPNKRHVKNCDNIYLGGE